MTMIIVPMHVILYTVGFHKVEVDPDVYEGIISLGPVIRRNIMKNVLVLYNSSGYIDYVDKCQ